MNRNLRQVLTSHYPVDWEPKAAKARACVLKALALKMRGEHPSEKLMHRIARDGLYTTMRVVGEYVADEAGVEGFHEDFSYFQYLEFIFQFPGSSSTLTLSSLPWDGVVNWGRLNADFVVEEKVDVDEEREYCELGWERLCPGETESWNGRCAYARPGSLCPYRHEFKGPREGFFAEERQGERR